ncbi:MAG: extracellular solute-binding protein [Ruminococcaceae bacterium]|nr:extracellular solute-binding protein [Oscillospiraceae bacterium]
MKKRIFALVLAVAMIATVLTGCGGTSETEYVKDDLSKEAHLVWVLAMEEPAAYPEVIEEVNKYLKEKINATLEIQFIQPADYATKVNMMLASQESDWDLMFTSNWQNPYENNVLLGGYYDLKEMLEKETPELYKFFPDSYWEALTLNGGIYAVPMNQVMYQQKGMWFKKETAEKYDLVEKIENMANYEDMEEIYTTVHENEPEMIVAGGFQYDLFEEVGTTVKGGFTIENGEVTDGLDEDKLNQYKLAREWYTKGFFPQEVKFEEAPFLKMGKIFSRYNRQLPGADAKHRISYDWDVINKATNGMILRREDVQGALTAINRMSKNPARALKLLELMTTDQYLFNLMAYGIEGVHYTKDGNRITPTENSYYVQEFRIGNQFLAYLMPGYEEGVWEETDKLNREAKVDENMGFVFDVTPVETEITNLNSATEYSDSLGKGTAEDVEGTFQKHLEKRKAAGDQKVKEEIEMQYAAWKATQE